MVRSYVNCRDTYLRLDCNVEAYTWVFLVLPRLIGFGDAVEPWIMDGAGIDSGNSKVA